MFAYSIFLRKNHHCFCIRPFENHLKKSSSFQNLKGSPNQNLNGSLNQNLKGFENLNGFQNRDFLSNGFPNPWEPRAGESMVPLPLQENTYLQERLLNIPPLHVPLPAAPPPSFIDARH